jgi:DNA polymerase-3 subunit delta'
VSSVLADRLHHAWLITGPAGIGKATLAFRFARWLLAGHLTPDLDVPEGHPVFRRVAAGTHADLLTIGRSYDEKRQRFRNEIGVEDVRPVGDFLRRTPAEGGWRAVILDDADALNRNAANALLKILEEPPPRAVLILVSSIPGRLLPTIRSRCRTLRLDPLDMQQMMIVLERLVPDQDETVLRLMAVLARGAPGQALALAGEDGIMMESSIRELLDGGGITSGRACEMVDRIMRREQSFSIFLELLADAVSDRVRQAARAGGPTLTSGSDWPTVWQNIRRVQDDAERFNLDKRQALLSSLSLLGER